MTSSRLKLAPPFLHKPLALSEWLPAMYMYHGHPAVSLDVSSRPHRVTACHYNACRNERNDGGGGIGVARYFIDHTIRAEQQDYEAEGVEWEHVDYFNNKVPYHYSRCVFYVRIVVCSLSSCGTKGNGGIFSRVEVMSGRPVLPQEGC